MTGWIPDVVPDQTIESTWGNSIRNRTVTPFPNTAARDAAITAPANGMLVWIDDIAQLQYRRAGTWAVLNDGPRGCLASKTLSGNAGFNNSYYDISSGGLPITVGAGRRIHINVTVGFYIVADNKNFGVRVERNGGGNVVGGGVVSQRATLDTAMFDFWIEDQPPAGSYVYYIAAATEHNVDVPLVTNFVRMAMIYDMGPVTAVPLLAGE